jgi:hypothetical protein
VEGTGWRRSRYDRLTAADAANLISESPAAPMHVALVGVLDGAPATVDGRLDLDRIRAAVAARLPALSRFRQVVLTSGFGCGYPVWVDAPDFDVGQHVVARPLAPPGDDAAFRRACGELAGTPLRPDRPLWRLDLLTGLADGAVGLVLRLHHAIADGTTAVRIGAVLLGADAPCPPPRPGLHHPGRPSPRTPAGSGWPHSRPRCATPASRSANWGRWCAALGRWWRSPGAGRRSGRSR